MSSIASKARLVATLATTAIMVACMRPTEEPVIRGPDGESAHLISCRDAPDCYEHASKICNGDYVIRESHGADDFPAARSRIGEHIEMLVSCKADLPSTESTASSERNDPNDARVCRAASKHLVAFGTYWAKQWGGSLLDEHPPADDFVVTCQAMPQNVQRCMHEKYRQAHAQACEALLVRLDRPSRTKIDALFLQVPTGPQAPPPGTTL